MSPSPYAPARSRGMAMPRTFSIRLNCRAFRIGVVLSAISVASVAAGELTIPHTFSAGSPAVAGQVNANFAAVVTAVNGNATDISALQTLVSAQAAAIAALQAELAALRANSVLALDGKLSLGADAQGQPTAMLSGVNVQIVNGLGSTGAVDGLGNLTIGYNENAPTPTVFCSNGNYIDQATCEANGELWAANQRTGSHNLILGAGNAYTRHGTLVAGYANSTNAAYASISGGNYNLARGEHSAISGGYLNRTDNFSSSVSGGTDNVASGGNSSISGGRTNRTTGPDSSVHGGSQNLASGGKSTLCGGELNVASGSGSSVNGGYANLASGLVSVVSGGYDNEATGDGSSVCGGITNKASGFLGSVGGGAGNTANGIASTVSGGQTRTAAGQFGWLAGSLLQEQ